MKPRTKLILKASIEDFIETGSPITSKYLYERYDFGVRSAMIRRELHALDKTGYLKQTHPSGGRVPTDKAYRLLVKSLLDQDIESELPLEESLEIMEDFIAGRIQRFTQELAAYLKLLSVVYEPKEAMVYNSGLQILFDTIEVESKKEMLRVIRDFERLPYTLEENRMWWQKEDEWPQVFIGPSPITKSHSLTVIANRLTINNEPILLITMGPRRMDYRKSLDFFRCFEEALQESK